jgi:hypothetical protein
MINYVVDLDGTLARYESGDVQKYGIGHIGDPLPGAVEFINHLAKTGKIIIFTVRLNNEVNKFDLTESTRAYNAIADWLRKHKFKWDEIYVGQGKPDGTVFIDDRGVSCRPQENPNAYEEVLNHINNVILRN